MKFAHIFALAIIVLGLLVTSASAKDFCDTPVVKSWLLQRDAVAVNIAQLFLKKGNQVRIREEAFELLRLEVLLSPCVPPLRPEDFYLLEIQHPDPELIPVAVFRGYLRKQGVSMDARGFFHGKTFWLETK